MRAIYGDSPDDNSHTNTVYLEGLFDVINKLDDRQQRYIKLRFQELGTRKWCGEQLGISTERARQIEVKVMRKLRNPRSTQQFQGTRLAKVKRLQYDNKVLNEENKLLTDTLKGIASGDILPEELLIVEDTITTKDIIHKKMSSVLVDDVDLSVRAYNCLRRAGLHTLGDIANLTEDELRAIRNVGRRTLSEIKDLLNSHGLSLKSET